VAYLIVANLCVLSTYALHASSTAAEAVHVTQRLHGSNRLSFYNLSDETVVLWQHIIVVCEERRVEAQCLM